MTNAEARKLDNGLYRLHWKKSHGGGTSVAAVGRDNSGNVWIAPTNWIVVGATRQWASIERVELITKA